MPKVRTDGARKKGSREMEARSDEQKLAVLKKDHDDLDSFYQQRVWKRAAEELYGASKIIIIGYSMPETDAFFRFLYGLGTVGPTLLQKFWIFDPSESVKPKFKTLLGPGAKQRFAFCQAAFRGDAVQKLREFLSARRELSL